MQCSAVWERKPLLQRRGRTGKAARQRQQRAAEGTKVATRAHSKTQHRAQKQHISANRH